MLAISSGNALVMHTYTLFTPLQFFYIVWMFEIVLSQQQGQRNHGEKCTGTFMSHFDRLARQLCIKVPGIELLSCILTQRQHKV